MDVEPVFGQTDRTAKISSWTCASTLILAAGQDRQTVPACRGPFESDEGRRIRR